jgi:hypothetical protein
MRRWLAQGPPRQVRYHLYYLPQAAGSFPKSLLYPRRVPRYDALSFPVSSRWSVRGLLVGTAAAEATTMNLS